MTSCWPRGEEFIPKTKITSKICFRNLRNWFFIIIPIIIVSCSLCTILFNTLGFFIYWFHYCFYTKKNNTTRVYSANYYARPIQISWLDKTIMKPNLGIKLTPQTKVPLSITQTIHFKLMVHKWMNTYLRKTLLMKSAVKSIT